MLYYFYRMVVGDFTNVTPAQVGAMFGETLASPAIQVGWMVATTIIGFGIVSLGLQKGVERITKWMMSFLFVIMILLAIRAVTLPGAEEGLRFYLLPNFDNLVKNGMANLSLLLLGRASLR
jgi:NSS family neurotransmitter:Na+ symporter